MKEVIDFDVGIAVVGALDFGALTKQGIRLIEEENRTAVLRILGDTTETLLRLADVFAHYTHQIDAIEGQFQTVSRNPRSDRFSCTARNRE